MVRVNLIKKVTCEQRPEGSQGGSLVRIQGKSISSKEKCYTVGEHKYILSQDGWSRMRKRESNIEWCQKIDRDQILEILLGHWRDFGFYSEENGNHCRVLSRRITSDLISCFKIIILVALTRTDYTETSIDVGRRAIAIIQARNDGCADQGSSIHCGEKW